MVLEVQLAMSRLNLEIARIRQDDHGFARAHHLRAAQTAYDEALSEACRLASVPLPDPVSGAVPRLVAEVELQTRGWSW